MIFACHEPMSLIHLYDPLETPRDIERFASYNFDDHLLVLAAVLNKRSINIPLLDIRTLDPQNPGVWALGHQSLHNATNAVFRLAGSDFSQIDFQDRQQLDNVKRLHAEEHRQWHLQLGI